MIGNLVPRSTVYKVSAAVSGGATVVNTTAVDLNGQNPSSVVWFTYFGAIDIQTNTPPKLQIQVSDNNSDWSDLVDHLAATVSTTIVAGHADLLAVQELVAPRHRYVRLSIVRTGSSNSIAIVSSVALVVSPHVQPAGTLGNAYTATSKIDT